MFQLSQYLELIGSIMQIVTGICALTIAVLVYRHNRRKDSESLKDRSWQAQQQLNFSCVNDIRVLNAFEFMIDGSVHHNVNDEDIKIAIYSTFIKINRLLILWRGWNNSIISHNEMIAELRPALRLIIGNRAIFDYCLSRGYDDDFRRFISEEANFVEQNTPKPLVADLFIKKLREA